MRAGALGLRALLAAFALACAACPGSLEDRERFLDGSTSNCPDIPTTLLATRCATAGCHSAADKAQGLDLESPDVLSRLVAVKSTGGSGYLIDPSDPAMSVIYTKLTSVPPFGARMPLVGGAVDDATLACVLSWASDSGGDAALPADDASPADGTMGLSGADAGPGLDAASSSSGGGTTDARPMEAAAPDAGPRDAGAPRDAGRPDAAGSGPDSGSPDATAPDSSTQDAPAG